MMKRLACLVAALFLALSPASAADRGWSTSNFLRLSSAPLTAAPMTLCVWFNTSITGTNQTLFGIYNSTAVPSLNAVQLVIGSGNKAVIRLGDSANSTTAITSTSISANTWMELCGVYASATSYTAYLNGGGAVTGTTSRVPVGLNQTSVGDLDQATETQPCGPAGTCDLAWPTIWNVALSAADIAELATGVDPRMVHPEAIVAFWPLDGLSPEPNVVSASTLAVQGSLSASNDPPLFRLHSP